MLAGVIATACKAWRQGDADGEERAAWNSADGCDDWGGGQISLEEEEHVYGRRFQDVHTRM